MPSIARFLWEYQLPLGLAIVLLGVILYLFSWYKDVNHDRKDFRSLLKTIREDIREIKSVREDVREIKDRLNDSPSAIISGSPQRLTEYGQKLSEFLDADRNRAATGTHALCCTAPRSRSAALPETAQGRDVGQGLRGPQRQPQHPVGPRSSTAPPLEVVVLLEPEKKASAGRSLQRGSTMGSRVQLVMGRDFFSIGLAS